jgi:hypothetical protein
LKEIIESHNKTSIARTLVRPGRAILHPQTPKLLVSNQTYEVTESRAQLALLGPYFAIGNGLVLTDKSIVPRVTYFRPTLHGM